MGTKVRSSNTLRHEYGHTLQLNDLGLGTYLTTVVAPSVTCYWLTDAGVLPDEIYNNYPWEYKANELGGARNSDNPLIKGISDFYYAVSKMISLL